MTQALTPENTPEPLSIAQEAKRAGLRVNTVYQRLRRNKSMEDALSPVDNFTVQQSKEELDQAKAFILRYKRENSGMPPSLTTIVTELNYQSNGKARNALQNLERQKWLEKTSWGKIVVKGERWLDPDQNKALQDFLAVALQSTDEAVQKKAIALRDALSEVQSGPANKAQDRLLSRLIEMGKKKEAASLKRGLESPLYNLRQKAKTQLRKIVAEMKDSEAQNLVEFL